MWSSLSLLLPISFSRFFLIQIMAAFSGTETEIIAKGLICSKFHTAYNTFIMCMLWLARVQAYSYLLYHLDSVLDNVLICIHPFCCTERMIFQPRKSTFASSELSMLYWYTLCWSFRLYRSCFCIIIQSSIHIRLFLGSSIKSETFIFLQPIKGRRLGCAAPVFACVYYGGNIRPLLLGLFLSWIAKLLARV